MLLLDGVQRDSNTLRYLFFMEQTRERSASKNSSETRREGQATGASHTSRRKGSKGRDEDQDWALSLLFKISVAPNEVLLPVSVRQQEATAATHYDRYSRYTLRPGGGRLSFTFNLIGGDKKGGFYQLWIQTLFWGRPAAAVFVASTEFIACRWQR